MKKFKIMAPAALLLVTLVFGGCERAAAAAETLAETGAAEVIQAVQTESIEAYRARVAELEAELKRLRGAGQNDAAPTVDPADGTASFGMTFTYRVENDAATLTGYRGDIAFVRVPDTLDGYPVVKIGQRAFEGTDVTVVELPDSVTEVDWFAFYGCAKLLYASLPVGVARIGYAVFDECPHVTVLCESGSYAEQYAKSYGLSTAPIKEG